MAPAEIVELAGVTEMEATLDVVPLPVRAAVWGLLLALFVTVSVAVRGPSCVGVKTTLIEQRLFFGTEGPHGVVVSRVVAPRPIAKSPPAVMPEMTSGLLRLFVRVTVFALLLPIPTLPKLWLAVERVACGTPKPVRPTV